MTLLEQASKVTSLADYTTIADLARKRGSSYNAVRMHLRRNPNIPIIRLGNVVLVKRSDFEMYSPRGYRKNS